MALGGLLGPLTFIVAWLVGGLIADPYDPSVDAISRLAARGAGTAPLMNIGFVGYGIGLVAFAVALRDLAGGWAWLAALVNGLATFAVALLPLEVSASVDGAHVFAAGVAYIAIAAVPILATRDLRLRWPWRAISVAVGVIAAVSLALSSGDWLSGLWQRVGLTTADIWLGVVGVQMWRSRSSG